MIFKPLSKNVFSKNNFGKSQYKIQSKDDELNTGNELLSLYITIVEKKKKNIQIMEDSAWRGAQDISLKKIRKKGKLCKSKGKCKIS